MNKTLNNESSPIASAYQSLTETTQYRHSENTHKSLIGLDCVISELKRIQSAHKAAGKSQKAAGLDRAIAVFRGMA
jgi:hypothetical protein